MLNTKKRGALSSTWIVAAIGLCCVAGCAPPGPRALLQGEKLLRKGEYELATRKFEEAARLLPRNAQAWNHLGLAYHGAKRFNEAIRAYQQALATDRNLAAPHYNLGCLHLEQNNLPAAISSLTSYTGLQPDASAGWLKLGTAQLRARQFDAAEKSLVQALKLSARSPEALNALGVVQFHRRRYAEATRQFTAASREQPDYAPALLNSAVIAHQFLTNRSLALQKYRDYLALKPESSDAVAVEQIASLLEVELRPAARLVSTPPPQLATDTSRPASPATETNKAAPPVSSGKLSASPAPTLTASLPPSSRPVVTNRAPPARIPAATSPPPGTEIRSPRPPKVEVVRVNDEEPVRPARDLIAANATQPANGDAARRQFSNGSGAPGQPERAGQILARSSPPVTSPGITRYRYHSPAAPKPGNRSHAERFLAQGVQAQERNRLDEAIDAYRKGTQADPSFFDVHYNLGVAAFEAGDLPRTLLAYEGALAIDPTSVKARFNFAIALQKAGYLRDAADELEKLLANRPDEPRAHFALGNLCAQSLDLPKKAREHYRRVLELEPQHSQATAIRFWLESNP